MIPRRFHRRAKPAWFESPRGSVFPHRADVAMVGDDLDEDQETTPENNPDQYLWAEQEQDDPQILDARDPDDRGDDEPGEDSDDEGSDTEDIGYVSPPPRPIAPPARVRPTDASRGLGNAIRSMVQTTKRTFSDVTTRALSSRMRQRGVALAIIVTTDGRVKVCQ